MVAIALKREYSNLYPSGWTVTREDKQGRKDNLNSDTPFKPVRPSSATKAQGSETPDNPEASQKSASASHPMQRRSPSATLKPPAKEYSTEYPQDWTLSLVSASPASTPSTQRRAKEFGQFDTNGPPPAKRLHSAANRPLGGSHRVTNDQSGFQNVNKTTSDSSPTSAAAYAAAPPVPPAGHDKPSLSSSYPVEYAAAPPIPPVGHDESTVSSSYPVTYSAAPPVPPAGHNEPAVSSSNPVVYAAAPPAPPLGHAKTSASSVPMRQPYSGPILPGTDAAMPEPPRGVRSASKMYSARTSAEAPYSSNSYGADAYYTAPNGSMIKSYSITRPVKRHDQHASTQRTSSSSFGPGDVPPAHPAAGLAETYSAGYGYGANAPLPPHGDPHSGRYSSTNGRRDSVSSNYGAYAPRNPYGPAQSLPGYYSNTTSPWASGKTNMNNAPPQPPVSYSDKSTSPWTTDSTGYGANAYYTYPPAPNLSGSNSQTTNYSPWYNDHNVVHGYPPPQPPTNYPPWSVGNNGVNGYPQSQPPVNNLSNRYSPFAIGASSEYAGAYGPLPTQHEVPDKHYSPWDITTVVNSLDQPLLRIDPRAVDLSKASNGPHPPQPPIEAVAPWNGDDVVWRPIT